MSKFSNDLALNIRPSTRALCSRLWYKTTDAQWNKWQLEGLQQFEEEFLSTGLPTPLEAQLLGLHRWALDQKHNAVEHGRIVAVLANVGFECMQTGDGQEREESTNGKPSIYYQPLTGYLSESNLWLDRHWGRVYQVGYNEAVRLPDSWHF